MDERHVVTCFLRNDGELLLLRRSDAVWSYQGLWGGVAGHVSGEPEQGEGSERSERHRREPSESFGGEKGRPLTSLAVRFS